MSLTFTKVADSDNVEGRLRSVIYDVTLDNSYPTGGEAITPANVGLNTIFGARHIGGNAAAGPLMFNWDTTNGKLMAFFPTGGATAPTTLIAPVVTGGALTGAPNAGTLSATTPAGATPVTSTSDTPQMVIAGAPGIGTLAVGASAAAAGIAKEVGNTGNLSTVVVRIQFFGV